MIEAEIILFTRDRTSKGYPLKVRVYCTNVQNHRYVALRKYQNGKKLRIDHFVTERTETLRKEVDFCNEMDYGLDKAQKTIREGIPGDNKAEIMVLEHRLKTLKTRTTKTFVELIDDDIKRRRDENKSIAALESLRREILNYDPDVSLYEVDFVWVRDFLTYKRRTTKSENGGEGGISYYVRTASTLFNDAIKMKLVPENPFKGHRIKRKRTKKRIVQDFTDIRRLLQYQPIKARNRTNIRNMNTRVNLFLFQLNIGGHYMSDVASFKWTDIKKGRLVFQREKNESKEEGGELIDNMLTPYALWFIDRYGTPQSERVFDWIPENKYTEWVKLYNKTLKRISNEMEISPKLESTSPRYIFRSAGGESRAHNLAIKQIQGHKFDGISEGYQGRFSNGFVDEEHQRILDFIFSSASSYNGPLCELA
ncbi:hypothetical protein FGF1_03960 [Flavobacteriaceae bacterium GF1]